MSKKTPVKVSGLIGSGAVTGNAPVVLPRFKGQKEFNDDQLFDIPLDKIKPNPYQPRRKFPEQRMRALANSIMEVGLLQRILLRKIDDDHYQIIAGERRFRAFIMLERLSIPAVLFVCDDADMAIMAIVENVNREDLSDFEIGCSIRNVENLFPSKTRLAESLGFQREDMYRYFAFESLPSFLLEKLKENPWLIGRNAAADIKRAMNNFLEHELPLAIDALKEAIALLEEGDIDQGKISFFMTSRVNYVDRGSIHKEKEEFFSENKKIGSFTKSQRGILIRISKGVLDADKEVRLKNLVNELINNNPGAGDDSSP